MNSLRRLVSAIALVALLGHAAPASAQLYAIEWNTEGIKVNPAANTVLCQYVNPNPNGESRIFHIVIASSVAAIPFLEQIAADGTTVVPSGGTGGRSQAMAVNTLVTFEGMKQVVTLDIGERIRVRTSGVLVGQIQCSLFLDN